MARRRDNGRGDRGPGWIATLLGMLVLIAGGFLVGLVVGVISEQPDLMVTHLVGHDEEIAWSPDADAAFTEPGAAESAFAWRSTESEGTAQPDSARAPTWEQREPPLPPVSTEVGPLRPAPEAGFAVQVGAFSDSSAAVEMSRVLGAKGYAVYVIPSAGSVDGRWRVRVGPVASQSQAQELARRLKAAERLPTWVVSEGGD